jgi:pimeloyl-ACP methyl ester carboxylesterase
MCHDAPMRIRPVVLVHGAWHGAWCWAALQAALEQRGISSCAVELPGHGSSPFPLTDLHGDAAAVTAALADLDGAVLVGHSYGGAVITEAAAGATNVDHLLYIAAFVPDAGESAMSLVRSMPRARTIIGAAITVGDDGVSTLDGDEQIVAALYGHCPPADAAAAITQLTPQPMQNLEQAVTAAAWRTIPSTYLCCAYDGAVHIDHQRLMADRCSHTVTFDTDHSPFMSAVGATADLVESLSRA